MRSGLARQFGNLWPGGRPVEAAALFDINDLKSRPRSENEARIRALGATAYLGETTALCRALGRFKMFVDTADIGLSPHLMLDGYWEMWLTEALAGAVRPGMTVVDVGANLGYFTLLMAELVGPEGRVHAFEPNPPILSRLRRSVSINGFAERVTCHPWALADQDGAEVVLIVPEGEPKNAHILPAAGYGGAPHAHRLLTRRLDGFAELERADVIKIDADTAEEAIWRGMAGLFARARPMTIFLEFASARYADPALFLREIRAPGFSLARLDLEAGLQPVDEAEILDAPTTVDQMLVLRR